MISAVFVQRIDWNGIVVEIAYEPDWLGMTALYGEAMAHLQVSSVSPERAPLPITETGYRSHFLPAAAVIESGGPVAYVRSWLEEAEKCPAWKEQQDASRQLAFF